MKKSPPILLLLLIAFSSVSLAGTNSPSADRQFTLAEITKPEKQIPFKEVIQATTHFRVLDFDTNNPAHVELKNRILRAAKLAGERAAKDSLHAARANEAGNHIESYVRAALRDCGLPARVPVNSAGEAQVTGYPDIEIPGKTPCYIELKTFSAATANTTQRTFYYSPSAHPKITRDALHFLLAYQLEKSSRDGETVFIPVHWKLITLEHLLVDLKFEFNQSNRGLYGAHAAGSLISEGAID
ncbi:MAG TPA: hypothetical protein VFM25_04540 [Verrucomicrobiae bacterium]|nr:hypothetical protein [Verrucomicrobiae bacterium]